MSTAKGKRVGRPRNPPPPPASEPHEAPEFVDRIQAIIDALEIEDLSADVRLHLQFRLRRYDVLRASDAQQFPEIGAEQITLLLRTVHESSNGAPALTLPILKAVSRCMNPIWVSQGLKWIESFDSIDLVGLHQLLLDLGIEDQFDRVLRRKLEVILGSPYPPVVQKKQPARPKPARPAEISQQSWNEVLAVRKLKRKKKAACGHLLPTGRPRESAQPIQAAA